MSLGADAVDGDAISDKTLDERNDSVDLSTSIVEVIIVDEELRGGVSFLGCAEGNVDELRPEDVVEDGRSPGSVIVEDFIYDILRGVRDRFEGGLFVLFTQWWILPL